MLQTHAKVDKGNLQGNTDKTFCEPMFSRWELTDGEATSASFRALPVTPAGFYPCGEEHSSATLFNLTENKCNFQ